MNPIRLRQRKQKKFLMGGFETVQDAKEFCIAENFTYEIGENID